MFQAIRSLFRGKPADDCCAPEHKDQDDAAGEDSSVGSTELPTPRAEESSLTSAAHAVAAPPGQASDVKDAKTAGEKEFATDTADFFSGASQGCPAAPAEFDVAAAKAALEKEFLLDAARVEKAYMANLSKAAEEKQEAENAGPPCEGIPKVEEPKDQSTDGYLRGERLATEEDRSHFKMAMTGLFREKYIDIRKRQEKAKAAKAKREAEKEEKSTLNTDMYENSMGLSLTDGHRVMDRPDHVDLPEGFREPVGVLTAEQLAEYGSDRKDGRFLICVYGELFDVSDRPDKYGPDGPYWELTGKDITWGLFAGIDTVEYADKYFDLFKAVGLGEESLRRKLAGLCSWLAFYELEYGESVGKLDVYLKESELPAPPLDEIAGCSVM
eukprot:TRINITY_DN123070_c0_g1_i1.p1 TRINITY_DN123070_c0_g1~~TRINITY_DN123070_c0_g1_i1.p1  ORF type:complete len:384 (+),score=109.72 TRINITY_DN123070_c0_g1_i1:78-1229(+)